MHWGAQYRFSLLTQAHIGVEHVGEVHYTLEDLDLNTIEKRKLEGLIVYRLKLTLEVRMLGEDGLLDFKILHEGKECGQAKLAFSYSVE